MTGKDLSAHAQIENFVTESFQSPFEEIKSAASYALGNIAVGNLPKYLPFIVDQIDNRQKKTIPLALCCTDMGTGYENFLKTGIRVRQYIYITNFI